MIKTVAAKKWVMEIGDSVMIDEKHLNKEVSMSNCCLVGRDQLRYFFFEEGLRRKPLPSLNLPPSFLRYCNSKSQQEQPNPSFKNVNLGFWSFNLGF
ncbi:Hypothetical predicted protein [Prunus dulcis]|uniref:Uncharacterized protein n=1 Tax=Prunus dulcis TaxID=3755 RepID=A0A5E4F6B0_PRUDU|nr:hypothetical protein L3X38_009129 [Prunus dulcis]VVA21308.1 Hypothetical predicted protein [Prunus dulcis]